MEKKIKKGFKFTFGVNFKRFTFLVTKTLIVFFMMFLVNLFGEFLGNRIDLKIDLCPDSINSLTVKTKNYLKNCGRKLSFFVCEPSFNFDYPQQEGVAFVETLKSIASCSSDFKIKFVPQSELASEKDGLFKDVEVLDYGLPSSGMSPERSIVVFMVDETDPNHRKGIFLNNAALIVNDCVSFDEFEKRQEILKRLGKGKSPRDERIASEYERLTVKDVCANIFERFFVSAIEKLANKNLIKVAATVGHSEYDFAMESGFFNSIGVNIEKVNLTSNEASLEGKALLIAYPRNDFSSEEIEKLVAFSNAGGRIIVLTGVEQRMPENLGKFLSDRGLVVSDDYVLSVRKERPSALINVDLKSQSNAYIDKMVEKKYPLLLIGGRPINLKEAQDGWKAFDVCKTSNDCVVVNKETMKNVNEIQNGEKSPRVVVAAAQKDVGSGKFGKIVVCASSRILNGVFSFGGGESNPRSMNANALKSCFTSNTNFVYCLFKEASDQPVFEYVPFKTSQVSRQININYSDEEKARRIAFFVVSVSLPFVFLIASVVVLILRRRRW